MVYGLIWIASQLNKLKINAKSKSLSYCNRSLFTDKCFVLVFFYAMCTLFVANCLLFNNQIEYVIEN